MRDPKRIAIVLERLRVAWEKHPDVRLGQLLVSAIPYAMELFYIEDDNLIEKIETLAKRAVSYAAEMDSKTKW